MEIRMYLVLVAWVVGIRDSREQREDKSVRTYVPIHSTQVGYDG